MGFTAWNTNWLTYKPMSFKCFGVTESKKKMKRMIGTTVLVFVSVLSGSISQAGILCHQIDSTEFRLKANRLQIDLLAVSMGLELSKKPLSELTEPTNSKNILFRFLKQLKALDPHKKPWIRVDPRVAKTLDILDTPLSEQSAIQLGHHLANAKDIRLVRLTLNALSEFIHHQTEYARYFKGINIGRWALEATDAYIEFLAIESWYRSAEENVPLSESAYIALTEIIDWQKSNILEKDTTWKTRSVDLNPMLRAYIPSLERDHRGIASGVKQKTSYPGYRLIRLIHLPLSIDQLKHFYGLDPAYTAMIDMALFHSRMTEKADVTPEQFVWVNPMDFVGRIKVSDSVDPVRQFTDRNFLSIHEFTNFERFKTLVDLNLRLAIPEDFESSAFMDLLKLSAKLDIYQPKMEIRTWTVLLKKFFTRLHTIYVRGGTEDLVKFLDKRVFNARGSEDRLWEEILLHGSEFAIRDFSSRLLKFAEDIQAQPTHSTPSLIDTIRDKIAYPAAKVPLQAYLPANPNIQSMDTYLNPTGDRNLAKLGLTEFKPVLVALITAALARPDNFRGMWNAMNQRRLPHTRRLPYPRYWAPRMPDHTSLWSRLSYRAQGTRFRPERVKFTDGLIVLDPSLTTMNSGQIPHDLDILLGWASTKLHFLLPKIVSPHGELHPANFENPLHLLNSLYDVRKELNFARASAIEMLWDLFVNPDTYAYEPEPDDGLVYGR